MLYKHSYVLTKSQSFKPLTQRGTFRLFILADVVMVLIIGGLLAYSFRQQESGTITNLRNEVMQLKGQVAQTNHALIQVQKQQYVLGLEDQNNQSETN